MTKKDEINESRRALLKTGMAAVAGGAAVTSGLLTASRADAAAGTAPKSGMMYQEKPHGKQKCANCIHFTPGKTADAAGTCNVVAGSILPQAWCVAYAPKG